MPGIMPLTKLSVIKNKSRMLIARLVVFVIFPMFFASIILSRILNYVTYYYSTFAVAQFIHGDPLWMMKPTSSTVVPAGLPAA